MGNKTNMAFFNAYIELDKACAKTLEIKKGGVSAYIGKLVEARFAPGRSEVLPKLVEYRKLRNIIAHEEDALSDLKDISKSDVQWLNRFTKLVEKKKDPISLYNRKANRFIIMRKLRIFFVVLTAIILAVLIFLILKATGSL